MGLTVLPRRIPSLTAVSLLVVAGLLFSTHYLMWALIAWFVAGSSHPQALDETATIGRGRTALGWVAVAILLAIVLPWPAWGVR